MKKNNKNKKIFVGVSGGVDSSVSAALLKDQGFNVVGVFMRTWQPDWIECTWRAERRDAIRVCAHLDIPFIELDLEREYKEGVADYMIAEYRKGRTPNPDVMCNREVKFGGFLKWALKHGTDYIATGHYVDRQVLKNGNIKMLRGNDPNKDQSYFLWTLEQNQLKHILFPVGNMPKSKVRSLALNYNIPVARKKDSQGICFIGEINMKDFLNHYIDENPGNVLNESGEIIGTHKGNLLYTIGERHGFIINKKGTDDGPYYVVDKNMKDNTLTVSQNPDNYKQKTKNILLEMVVDNQDFFKKGMRLEAQIRYRGEVKRIEIISYNKKNKTMEILFDKTNASLAPGQSVVFYDDNICLGGGIIA